VLVAVSLYVFFEAIHRWLNPPEIRGGLMMAVAAGGLGVNLAVLFLLRSGRHESLNLQGAWLHVLADTFGSLQAIIAGALILTLGWYWVDAVASVLIGLLVIVSSWKLLKESIMVLMEGSPGHIDVDAVQQAMLETEEVEEVHDLHIWTITSGLVALSAHVACNSECNRDELLSRLRNLLSDRFSVSHTTIQVEGLSFQEDPPEV